MPGRIRCARRHRSFWAHIFSAIGYPGLTRPPGLDFEAEQALGKGPNQLRSTSKAPEPLAPTFGVPWDGALPDGGTETYGTMYGMERTTVYLTERQKRALERAARSEGRSEAELIREGVDLVTSRHEAAELRLPLFESGQRDLASRVDEELVGFGER